MAQAIETMGKWMTVEEVLKEVLADEMFYSRSGGGLTLSGGKPLLQAEFATALLKQAHAEGLETAIETTGCVPWESALPVFEQLDFIHMDIKSVDAEKHRTFTGHDNALILENFTKLCATFPDKPINARQSFLVSTIRWKICRPLPISSTQPAHLPTSCSMSCFLSTTSAAANTNFRENLTISGHHRHSRCKIHRRGICQCAISGLWPRCTA